MSTGHAQGREREDPQPEYDALHPSGHVLFRSARGGYLHSVVIGDEAMRSDARSLAEAIVLTADVSFFRALIRVRQEIVDAGFSPSADVPTSQDLAAAAEALGQHKLLAR